MTSREMLEAHFLSDLSRVGGLVSLFESDAGTSPGGRSGPSYGTAPFLSERFHQPSDLLRAAIVLLHASLEDFFRSIARWKLPMSDPGSLEKIPLAGLDRDKLQFTLADLAEFRGRPVDEVIAQSVEKYLERSNYNHPGDLTDVLKKTGIAFAIPIKLKAHLAALMKRRHWIAHRVDRDPLETIDPDRPLVGQAISPDLVREWLEAVAEVGKAVLEVL